MKVKIEIDTKTFVRFLLVVSVFVGVVFLLWKLLPVLMLIGLSFFLAIALNKPVTSLARHLPGQSRIFAAAISYVVFLIVLGLFFSLLVPAIMRQTSAFISSLPGYIQQISDHRGVAADFIQRYQLQGEVDAFVQGIQRQASTFAQGIGSDLVAGLSTLLTGLVALISLLVLTFLMLIEGPRWKEQLWRAYNDQAMLQHHQELVHKMYRVVTSYVNGQVLVAAIAGTMATLTLFVLTHFFAVPATVVLPLGVVMLLGSLMPMIGPTIGAVIVTLALLFNDFGAAVAFLIYFIIYEQIEANIIQPTVQSKTVELSALTILMAVIAGVMLFGLIGALFAIPIAGCLRVLVLDFIERRQKEKKAHHATLAKAS